MELTVLNADTREALEPLIDTWKLARPDANIYQIDYANIAPGMPDGWLARIWYT